MNRNNRGRGRRRGRGAGAAGNRREAGAAGGPAANRRQRNAQENVRWDDYLDLSTGSEDSDSDGEIQATLHLIGMLGGLERKSGGRSRNYNSSTTSGAKASILYTEDSIAVNTIYASFKWNTDLTEQMVRDKFGTFGTIKNVRIHTHRGNDPEPAASPMVNASEGGDEAAAVVPVSGRGGYRKAKYRPNDRIIRYAFISFATCEEAARCIHNRSKLVKDFHIAVADSWHQEAYQKRQNEQNGSSVDGASGGITEEASSSSSGFGSNGTSLGAAKADREESIAAGKLESEVTKDTTAGSVEEGMSILELNDDCLMLIFDYFGLMDLISLRKSCTRFSSIALEMYKRYKVLNFDLEAVEKTFLTMLDAKTILTEVGPFVDELHISMNRFKRPAMRVLNLIPRHCERLTSLNIEDFTLNAKTLKGLGPVFKNLEGLSLDSCGVGDFVEGCLGQAKKLQKLDLSCNSEITGKCLRVVKNLKHVNLEGCQNLQGKPFSVFAEKNKSVQYLNITGCNRLTSEAIKSLVTNMNELEHLVCNSNYENADPDSVALLAKLPKLKRLQIKVNSYSPIDPLMNGLAEANHLEHLDLSDGIYTAFDYNVLSKLTNLKILRMNYKLDFVDEHLAKLCSNGNFVELHIAGCTQISDNQLIAFIRANPLLTRLDISYCQISESLVFSAVDILKEQSNGTGRVLTLVVGQTSICPVIMNNALIKSHRHLLNISFDSTEGFYGSMDDDVYDDMIDDDEDFMGYDFEDSDADLWGLDYDSDLVDFADMCQYFYDSDDPDRYMYGWGNVDDNFYDF